MLVESNDSSKEVESARVTLERDSPDEIQEKAPEKKEANKTSKNEEEEVTVSNGNRDDVSKATKVLVWIISVLFVVVDGFLVYRISTGPDRQICQTCTESDSALPGFFWYTTWCLVLTSATWFIYVRRRFFPDAMAASPPQHDDSNLPAIFRVCLPLSVTVTMAYTYYFASNDWGRAIYNDELCYTVLDSAIPKEGTSLAGAVIFLVLDRISNFTSHYLCAIISLTLYFKSYTHGHWRPLYPWCYMILHSTLIVLMHEFVDEIYCTDNIIMVCVPTALVYGALHAGFFCRSTNEEEEEEEEEEELERSYPMAGSSTMAMLRFSAGMAGYRIVRLSVELFLIMRVQELNWNISQAGLIFLIYSLASMFGSLILIWFPTLFLGSMLRALSFLVLTVGATCAGFIFAFNVQEFWSMALFASLSALGTAIWSTNYRTITNLAFPPEVLGKVALLNQMFESIGFLIPSICLAIVVSITDFDLEEGEDDSGDNLDTSVVRQTTSILGAAAGIFHLLSFDQVFAGARWTHPSSKKEKSFFATVKVFFGTSVFKVFMLNAIILALSNILMATMSLITESIFGMEPTYLWIAAIGFPLGGMTSVLAQLVSTGEKNAKSSVLAGSAQLSVILSLCLGLSPMAPPGSEKVAKTLLFAFGFILGMVYSVTFASGLELWLLNLKDHETSFVSRASVVYGLGMQALIALVFEVQTTIVDAVLDGDSSSIHEAAVFFSPLIGFCLVIWLVVRSIPYPKEKIFGWPLPTPFDTSFKIKMYVFKWAGLCSPDAFAFARFSEYRMGLFSPHLKESNANKGPEIPRACTLCSDGLKSHLMKFDGLQTNEDWWQLKGKLHNILLDNEASLEKRLELAENASSSIWIITWAFEKSTAGDRLADTLIKRAQEGLDVRVLVDAVTLYFSYKKECLTGTSELDTLRKLGKGGVEIKMIDAWYEDKQPSYVIGSHRKILIVDNAWMITGGRNIDERYFISKEDCYHFMDADVLLSGDFRSSASTFYKSMWSEARDTPHIFEKGVGPSLKTRVRRGSAFLSDGGFGFGGGIDGQEVCNQRSLRLSVCKSLRSNSGALEKLEADLEKMEGMQSDVSLGTEGASKSAEIVLPRRRSFFRTPSRSSLVLPANDVSMFMLDHKGGDPDGYDIIYSTLVYLIETAQETVDLLFGMFQLFPELDDAISRALQRGIKIRLVTNSDKTGDLTYLFELYRRDFIRLLELGVEIYIPSEEFGVGDFTLHHKVAVFDRQAALVGSWNCFGMSVFYDSDFSVVLFSEEQTAMFEPFEDLIEDAIQCGNLVRMTTVPEGFKVPLVYKVASARNSKRMMERGF